VQGSLAPTHGAHPEVIVRYNVARAALQLRAGNTGERACRLTIKSPAYRAFRDVEIALGARRRDEHLFALSESAHWYDFIVTSDHDPSFVRRFAGRLETGAHGISDPALG
jgi:phospholipase C